MTEALIERECSIQVRKWRESRGELTHQPVRRLHGTRDIHEHKRRASAISSGGSFSFLGSIPPPGPLRASSSLLSLPGFRKSKTPFRSQKKGSFSGASGMEAMQRQNPSHKPPMSSGSVARAPASQSPLVGSGPAQTSAQSQPGASASAPVHHTPPNTLSPKVTSEQITPTIPSPTANNTPLPPFPDGGRGGAATGGEDDRKKKRSKEDKKKEKEEEKRKEKEKKKDKADKESQKKEKERAEKEKKKEKGGKKKDRGGGEAEEKNGATAPRDSA